jgi:hypothetical protein
MICPIKIPCSGMDLGILFSIIFGDIKNIITIKTKQTARKIFDIFI